MIGIRLALVGVFVYAECLAYNSICELDAI
jgi:hypothetical protein